MKRIGKDLDALLDRHLGLFKAKPQSDAAREEMLRRLQSQAAQAEPVIQTLPASSSRFSYRYPLAAAAVFMLALVTVGGLWTMRVKPDTVARSLDGSLLRVSGVQASQFVYAGEEIKIGEVLRANTAGATISLADGTRVQMRAQSEFSVERAEDGIRIHLRKGSLRIHAAPQLAGHLYVQTKDVTVSVIGTVFLVNAEEEGSRVAVIEGEVRVQFGATTKSLVGGEQLSTNPKMELLPVKEESWSQAEFHVASTQQPVATPAAAPKKLEFEVASIRPSTAPEPYWVGCRGADGIVPSRKPEDITIGLGRCEGSTSLNQLIGVIYPHPLRRSTGLVQGGCCFDVRAIASDPARTTKEELRQMLEKLVVEQFKLKVHTEVREQPGYWLTVAGSGLKIKELQNPPEGQVRLTGSLPVRVLEVKDTLDEFARFLSQLTGNGPVQNKTGLSGPYEIRLVLNRVSDPNQALATGPRGGGDANALRQPTEYDPPLAKALEDQLGLKLEFGKPIPFEWLIVDSFERPTGN